MTEWKAKRFWKDVLVAQDAGGFAIHLDGRPVRTPAKSLLIVPTRAFADLIAQEWRDQGEVLDPTIMPATRTANVAIDKVATKMGEVIAHLLEYGGSDLLCYRATGPEELIRRQAENWDPLLDWSARTLGAPLQTAQGVMPIAQPAQSIEQFRSEILGFSAFELAAFHELVSLSGSLVLSLAVSREVLPAAKAWELSRLDEQYQQDQWGEDEEATQAAQVKGAAFDSASQMLIALRNGG